MNRKRFKKYKHMKYKTLEDSKYPIGFNIPTPFTWNLDSTLAFFIRDCLREFVKHNNGIPFPYCTKGGGGIEAFHAKCLEIADKFDKYDSEFYFEQENEVEYNKLFEDFKNIFPALWW